MSRRGGGSCGGGGGGGASPGEGQHIGHAETAQATDTTPPTAAATAATATAAARCSPPIMPGGGIKASVNNHFLFLCLPFCVLIYTFQGGGGKEGRVKNGRVLCPTKPPTQPTGTSYWDGGRGGCTFSLNRRAW